MLFWETGAVGRMGTVGAGRLVFRVSPSGANLGRAAVDFAVDQLAPMFHRTARSLRFAVAKVDDVYGGAVAQGAIDRIRSRGLTLAGVFPYDPNHLDARSLISRIAATRADVLFVAAYLQDGVALRKEQVRQRLPLMASIGTSSSYCMPQFGHTLGQDAVGVFASDKPDAESDNPEGLPPATRTLLAKAAAAYRTRYGQDMSSPALAGFSAAWALFHHVMPRAGALTPAGVAQAAQSIRIPSGGLPNGSGLEFGPPGTPDAGANLLAASVIEEWVGIDRKAVVWPPRYATAPVRAIPLDR
jgi:branched-chain amino acid transport system substrate-binding protein